MVPRVSASYLVFKEQTCSDERLMPIESFHIVLLGSLAKALPSSPGIQFLKWQIADWVLGNPPIFGWLLLG